MVQSFYGGPVSGDRFWPRPMPLDEVVQALGDGSSVALFGPRRTGKSSLMAEAARVLAKQHGRVAVFIDVEGKDRLAALVLELMRHLPTGLLDRWMSYLADKTRLPKVILDNIGHSRNKGAAAGADPQLESDIRAYWGVLAQELGRTIRDTDHKAVLFIDELPFMCEDLLKSGAAAREVEEVLATLRQWRQAGLPMAISGSIGLRGLLARYGIPSTHINDLVPVRVPPLTGDEATAFVAALAAKDQLDWWTADTTAALVGLAADLYPSFLQFAFTKIRAARAATTDAVTAIYQAKIRPDLDFPFYNQFDDRLRRYHPAEQAAARRVFAEVAAAGDAGLGWPAFQAAVAGDTTAEPVDPQILCELLVGESFLADDPEGDQVRFALRLVAAWWQSRRRRSS